jgi:hypothetical protein
MGLDQIPDDKEIEEKMGDFYNEILPKKEPDEMAAERFRTPEPIPSRVEIDGSILIQHLLKHPFLNYKQLITKESLSPTRGDDARAWMIRLRFAVMHSITLRRGKPGEYFELTPKAYEHFEGTPPAGKGGFEHKCFCHTISDSMEEEGFEARVEGPIKGSSKLFDVLAWKKGEGMFGYEVTLTFHNLVKNLRDDLGTTVKKVIVVCRNREELKIAQAIVKKELGELSRVEFKTIFEFTQKNKD